MKRIKTIIFLLSLFVLSACLYSCNDNGEQQDSKYYAIKALDSYEDLESAFELIKIKHSPEPVYTVTDDFGEGYEVVYYFNTPHCHTTYPVSFEEYFTDKTYGKFETLIFLEDTVCEDEMHETDHIASYIDWYKEDPDYDKYTQYIPCQTVWIHETKAVETIEDISSMSYRLDEHPGHPYKFYHVSYGETDILSLRSCVELDDGFFNKFYEHLAIIE